MIDRSTVRCLVILAASASATAGWGQTASGNAQKTSKYGTPLDTLRNTRFWTDVPPAQDFVTETRPDTKDLNYTPLTGDDPVRPKPRDAANVRAFQMEMERFGADNEAKARGLRGAKSAKVPRKGAAVASAPAP